MNLLIIKLKHNTPNHYRRKLRFMISIEQGFSNFFFATYPFAEPKCVAYCLKKIKKKEYTKCKEYITAQ